MWVIERQALPYLAIIGLFALLTLPAPWRGLRSVNGWLLLLTYLAYLAQALLRGREKGEDLAWHRRERWMAAAGIGALAVGAYFTVFSTERIVSALAISKVWAACSSRTYGPCRRCSWP